MSSTLQRMNDRSTPPIAHWGGAQSNQLEASTSRMFRHRSETETVRPNKPTHGSGHSAKLSGTERASTRTRYQSALNPRRHPVVAHLLAMRSFGSSLEPFLIA